MLLLVVNLIKGKLVVVSELLDHLVDAYFVGRHEFALVIHQSEHGLGHGGVRQCEMLHLSCEWVVNRKQVFLGKVLASVGIQIAVQYHVDDHFGSLLALQVHIVDLPVDRNYLLELPVLLVSIEDI